MEVDKFNFLKLCLLCASAPDAKHDHIGIYSKTGREERLWEKIHKHLTIKVEDEMPQNVCNDCIDKLNVCHNLVISSEEAHAKLLAIQEEWLSVIKTEPMESEDFNEDHNQQLSNGNEHSPIISLDDIKIEETCLTEIVNDSADLKMSEILECKIERHSNPPSPLDVEISQHNTENTKQEYGNNGIEMTPVDFIRCKNEDELFVAHVEEKEEVENLEIEVDPEMFQTSENLFQIHPILKSSSHMIIGSQLAFFYAEKRKRRDERPFLYHVVINMDEETACNKMLMLQKISRIAKQCKQRAKYIQDYQKTKNDWNIGPSYFCESCRCSFFLKNEMVSHFESLHPTNIRKCFECGKNIYGSEDTMEKHMKLHRSGHDSDIYSSNNYRYAYEPEFSVIPLGRIEKRCEKEAMRLMLLLNIIAPSNSVIRVDMKPKIWIALKKFILGTEQMYNLRENLVVQCDICKIHMSKRRLRWHVKDHLKRDKQENKEANSCPTSTATSVVKTPSYINTSVSSIQTRSRSSSIARNSLIDESSFDSKIACCHCGQLISKDLIGAHIEVKHFGGKYLICRICDDNYQKTGLAQPHMMSRTCQRFKCPYPNCKRGYMFKTFLDTHIKSVHKSPGICPVYCDFCGKVFSGKAYVSIHIRAVHLKTSTA